MMWKLNKVKEEVQCFYKNRFKEFADLKVRLNNIVFPQISSEDNDVLVSK